MLEIKRQEIKKLTIGNRAANPDGIIYFHQMKLLLYCFLEQLSSLDLEAILSELTAILFRETDVDQLGYVSLEGLRSSVK
ncbi:unnamed protein product [Rotaria sordida]|uniref:EF-hand domain-containing protein n=1 Tax=Rotaria sordida TaxID=392033 RepID=A0A818VY18_9BILA|nr:unnamed protein product [Rotaria sordida]